MLKKNKGIIIFIGCVFVCIMAYLIIDNVNSKVKDNIADSETVEVYFVDSTTNQLVSEVRHIEKVEIPSMVYLVLSEFMSTPSNPNHINIIPEDVVIENISFVNETDLIVRFSGEYKNMTYIQEVLGRSALALTLTGINGIENVRIYVDDEELLKSTGEPVGELNRNNIQLNPQIYPEEVEENTRILNLYFGNEDLTGLVLEKRIVKITSARSLEEQIFNELIKGSEKEGLYSYLPQDISLLDINTIDNITYIDLSREFDTRHPMGMQAQELAIYSIVNSLTSMPELMIEEVQFLIESQKTNEYSGYIDISQPFFRNEEIIIAP